MSYDATAYHEGCRSLAIQGCASAPEAAVRFRDADPGAGPHVFVVDGSLDSNFVGVLFLFFCCNPLLENQADLHCMLHCCGFPHAMSLPDMKLAVVAHFPQFECVVAQGSRSFCFQLFRNPV